MHRAAMTIFAALTALAFAGCTGNSDQAGSPAGPETSEVNPATNATEPADQTGTKNTPATAVDTDSSFAVESLEHLLATLNTVYDTNADEFDGFTGDCDAPFKTLEEFRECSPDDPIAYLDTIESPQDGELIVTPMPEAWGGGDYDPDRVFTVPYLAEILHGYICRHTDGPLKVTVMTPDGQYHATQGRLPHADNSDAPESDAELHAWADARFEDWLRSMNFTYQGLCGGVDSVEDYRQCVPDDPHGYITSMEAPAHGELIVHVQNGAWQGGRYEPAAEFMAGNMMVKIGSYSSDLDLLTVVTEDGQSHTVEYAPEHNTYSETSREPTL